MAMRIYLPLALLGLAFIESLAGDPGTQWQLTHFVDGAHGDGGLDVMHTCGGLVGDCIEAEEEMMMESETSRRSLAQSRKRFVSYGALSKDRVPCNRRGHSYYNCRRKGRANPYRRGCSIITKCGRIFN